MSVSGVIAILIGASVLSLVIYAHWLDAKRRAVYLETLTLEKRQDAALKALPGSDGTGWSVAVLH